MTRIENDGATLTMELRGTFFIGSTLDDFEPASETPPEFLSSFRLSQGTLVGYELRSKWPIRLLVQGESVAAQLGLQLKVGVPEPGLGGRVNAYSFALSLNGEEGVGTPLKESEDFERGLLDLELPAGTSFHACISCAFSDYSPYGSGLFGTLACFRDTKEEYRQVRGKNVEFLWPRMAGLVQETFLCDDFEKRMPGTGYRG